MDRWYIEHFLATHAHLVRGRALEIQEDRYASRYGAAAVDVLDIDPTNPRATVVGDLCDPATLPTARYDVALVTQTLQLLAEPVEAVRHLLQSLRPGGSLLVTAPTLSRIVGDSDRWRWTPLGMRDLLTRAAPSGAVVESVGLGNGLAARAFLFGLALEDFEHEVIERPDALYPLVVGGRVRLAD